MNERQPLRYSITPTKPQAHLFTVQCTVPEPDAGGQVFSLPAWIPGSYMIRDFARNVVRLWARTDGGSVAVEKIDKQTWRCAPCVGELTVEYEVYAWDLSVRAAYLDTTRGYFNGTSVLLLVHGHRDRPCVADIRPPEGEAFGAWRVATAMPRAGAPAYGFGSYRAADYDELVDHPVEMGAFSLATFEAGGVPHDIVIAGRHRADLDRLCRDLRAICEQHIGLFGEPPPMARYVFLTMVVGDGYGGLEHRASCSLLCSRDDLPRAGEDKVGDGYRGFLGLCSHEYFHTWNVKRVKPAAFTPYDLSREVHTRLLWAFEGITSYYDDLSLVRCGRITEASYLELLSQTITRVWRGSGRFKQTVAESSFDAWTKFYKQDENAPNAIVSYYAKGALAALVLDLTVRLASGDAVSLDDVMRVLWDRYGRAGIGVPEDGVERLAEEVTGVSLQGTFERLLRSTEDPDLGPLLREFGIDFRLRPAESAKDKGGKPAAEPSRGKPLVVLGVRVAANGGGATLSHVLDGGAAQAAGLSAGDTIIAVDGLRVDANNLEQRLQTYRPGDTVAVHAFRRDELMQFEVTPKAAPEDTCVLTPLQDLEPQVERRRASWLHGD